MEMLMVRPNLTNGTKLQMIIIGKEDATTAEKKDMKRQNVILHIDSDQQQQDIKERILSGVVRVHIPNWI